MRDNQLDEKCMNVLGLFLQNNDAIENIFIGKNALNDESIDLLKEYIFGNDSLKILDFSLNKNITDMSLTSIIEIAQSSAILDIVLHETALSAFRMAEIRNALKIFPDEREIPLKSNAKSAAKISFQR